MHDKNKDAKPKVGAGHWQAMGRLGLAELRNAVSLSNAQVEAPTEPGVYGTATPSEVVSQRQDELQHSPGAAADGRSVLEGRLDRAADRAEQGRDRLDRGRESMERE